jgi:hypothetical protein
MTHVAARALLHSDIELAATNCTQLAATLSAAYEKTDRFTGTTTAELEDYLASTGLLITQCTDRRGDCSVLNNTTPGPSRHWSGSWTNAETRLRIFPGSYLGIVANPHTLGLRCAFPTDAGSDDRDDDGCGPLISDPVYGSGGASRMSRKQKALAHERIRNQLREKFPGRDCPSECPCSEFFAGYPSNGTAWLSNSSAAGACAAMKGGRRALRYEPFFSVLAGHQEAIYGAPVCSVEEPAPRLNTRGYWWEYDGECSWEPREWQSMVDAMLAWFAPNQEMMLWNEVIAPKPETLEQEVAITQAIYYITTPTMNTSMKHLLNRVARRNAELFGRPLLELDAQLV